MSSLNEIKGRIFRINSGQKIKIKDFQMAIKILKLYLYIEFYCIVYSKDWKLNYIKLLN